MESGLNDVSIAAAISAQDTSKATPTMQSTQERPSVLLIVEHLQQQPLVSVKAGKDVVGTACASSPKGSHTSTHTPTAISITPSLTERLRIAEVTDSPFTGTPAGVILHGPFDPITGTYVYSRTGTATSGSTCYHSASTHLSADTHAGETTPSTVHQGTAGDAVKNAAQGKAADAVLGAARGAAKGAARGLAGDAAEGVGSGTARDPIRGVDGGRDKEGARGAARNAAKDAAGGKAGCSARGSASSLAEGAAIDSVGGLAEVSARGLTRGLAGGSAGGSARGLTGSLAGGLAGGLAEDKAAGLARGLAKSTAEGAAGNAEGLQKRANPGMQLGSIQTAADDSAQSTAYGQKAPQSLGHVPAKEDTTKAEHIAPAFAQQSAAQPQHASTQAAAARFSTDPIPLTRTLSTASLLPATPSQPPVTITTMFPILPDPSIDATGSTRVLDPQTVVERYSTLEAAAGEESTALASGSASPKEGRPAHTTEHPDVANSSADVEMVRRVCTDVCQS